MFIMNPDRHVLKPCFIYLFSFNSASINKKKEEF